MRFSMLVFFLGLMFVSVTGFAAAKKAPAIVLPERNGEFHLSKHKGKVVYLDFWASWCKPCRKSFPWMNEMQSRYKKQGLVVVAINLDTDRKLADVFLSEVKADFTIAFDAKGDVATKYKLQGMPSSFLIGRDGKLYASHVGFREKDKAKMEKAIRRLLK